MFYNYIYHPITNKKINIHTKKGISILKNYIIFNFGGSSSEKLKVDDTRQEEIASLFSDTQSLVAERKDNKEKRGKEDKTDRKTKNIIGSRRGAASIMSYKEKKFKSSNQTKDAEAKDDSAQDKKDEKQSNQYEKKEEKDGKQKSKKILGSRRGAASVLRYKERQDKKK